MAMGSPNKCASDNPGFLNRPEPVQTTCVCSLVVNLNIKENFPPTVMDRDFPINGIYISAIFVFAEVNSSLLLV